jgi:hypothetical protein
MQPWLTIMQGTATLSALGVAVVNLDIARKGPRKRTRPARRYLCLSVDVQGYGRNDDLRQAQIQHDLIHLLDHAAAQAGLDRRRWIRQPKGDEELALVPADQPLHRVVGDFCLELATALWHYNQGHCNQGHHNQGHYNQGHHNQGHHDQAHDPCTRVRLRLGLDDGPVDVTRNGYVGRAVVGVSRLVNAQPLRQALDRTPHADLAVLLSDGLHRDWIHSGRSSVHPDWCHRVTVTEKEYEADAWLWLPRPLRDMDESRPAEGDPAVHGVDHRTRRLRRHRLR